MRICTVRIVHELNYTTKKTVYVHCKFQSWVKQWVRRFREDRERTGISCLCNRPRKGKPRKVSKKSIYEIIQKMLAESMNLMRNRR